MLKLAHKESKHHWTNPERLSGVAVSVTWEPGGPSSVHAPVPLTVLGTNAQLIAPEAPVTVPPPVPPVERTVSVAGVTGTTTTEAELLPYRGECVLASRAADLEPPIDTVWTDLMDPNGFANSTRHIRSLGFQGKLCIHPEQVPIVNAILSPSAEQIDWSRKVVEAFKAAEAAGSASIQLEGRFIDYPIFHRARRVLATAQRIAARSK